MITTNSSWISSISYRRGFLALFLNSGIALLYGPNVPSWIPGLIKAGTGRRSIGLAYNRLVKGRYSYQRVEDRKTVEELREMIDS